MRERSVGGQRTSEDEAVEASELPVAQPSECVTPMRKLFSELGELRDDMDWAAS